MSIDPHILSEISDIIKESIKKFNLEVSCSKSCSCKLCKNVDDPCVQSNIIRSASSRIIDLVNSKEPSERTHDSSLNEVYESVIKSIIKAFSVVKCNGDYNCCESYYDVVIDWFESYKSGRASLGDCPYLPNDVFIEGYEYYGTISNPSNTPIQYSSDDESNESI